MSVEAREGLAGLLSRWKRAKKGYEEEEGGGGGGGGRKIAGAASGNGPKGLADLHSKLAIDIRSPYGESREPRIKAYNFHARRNVSLCARRPLVLMQLPAKPAGANTCIKHDKSSRDRYGSTNDKSTDGRRYRDLFYTVTTSREDRSCEGIARSSGNRQSFSGWIIAMGILKMPKVRIL